MKIDQIGIKSCTLHYGHIELHTQMYWETTPFNMVFGLNAVLPIEFLIPTLRIVKELQWTGHEWSQRLDDLDKLDET